MSNRPFCIQATSTRASVLCYAELSVQGLLPVYQNRGSSEVMKKESLTSILDVHDITEQGRDALRSWLPDRVTHHPLQLFPE